MKKIIYAICIAFMGIMVMPDNNAQQKYALLISPGETVYDDFAYHSEYWYDMFWMYRMLIDRGYKHNNIFVLYGNGVDFNSDHAFYNPAAAYPGQTITDYAVTAHNVDNIFNWLANGYATDSIPKLQMDDFLFFWWMGHGSATTMTDYEAFIATTGEVVTDNEFDTYFDRLPACLIKAEYVMTCHSGALTDDLESLHSMIHTATEYDKNAYSDLYDVYHAELSYYVACALEQRDPTGAAIASDSDGNTIVTLEETNDYVHTNTILSSTVIADYRNISPFIDINDATPASSVPVEGFFSRDHHADNGTVPSNYQTWYNGPDLWVRWFQDDDIIHQNPEFGQTNYVYSRVHNIGCKEINGAKVNFTWCPVSAWANPASWTPIGNETLNNLVSGESRVINTVWNAVPAPGYYCLHTVLKVVGDMPNADGRAYMDNNKVQINVVVEDNVWGWTVVYPFFIENGRNSFSKVDLVIDKSNFFRSDTKIKLELPSDLKLENVEGGEIEKLDLVNRFHLEKDAKSIVVKGIPLEANEKKLVLMTVTLPKEEQKRVVNKIIVSEIVDRKEVGGIVFKTKPESEKVVLTKHVLRLYNTFKMLSNRYGVKSALELAEFLKESLPHDLWVKDFTIRPQKIEIEIFKKLVEFEKKTLPEMKKLMKMNDFVKYEQAVKLTIMGLEKENIAIIKEAQERLMYATIPLFITNK